MIGFRSDFFLTQKLVGGESKIRTCKGCCRQPEQTTDIERFSIYRKVIVCSWCYRLPTSPKMLKEPVDTWLTSIGRSSHKGDTDSSSNL